MLKQQMDKIFQVIHFAKTFKRRIQGFPDLEMLKKRGLKAGDRVTFGAGCFIDPDFCHLITIGNNSGCGPGVMLLAHDASMFRHVGLTKFAPVTIGSNCHIGAGSILLPGTTIGDNCVIGAGSIVRSDVPANSLVIGNPAEVIGTTERFLNKHKEGVEQWIDLTVSRGFAREDLAYTNVDGVLDQLQPNRSGYVL